MIRFESSVLVDGISGSEITKFLLQPAEGPYQEWWPDTHLQFHVIAGSPGPVGEVVWMDEYVGSRGFAWRRSSKPSRAGESCGN